MRARITTAACRIATLIGIAFLSLGCAQRESLSVHNTGETRLRVDVAQPHRSYQPFAGARHYSVTLAPDEQWSTRDASPEDAARLNIQPSGRAVIRVHNASLSSPTTREYLIDFASTPHASITIEHTGEIIRAFLTERDGAFLELTPSEHRWFPK